MRRFRLLTAAVAMLAGSALPAAATTPTVPSKTRSGADGPPVPRVSSPVSGPATATPIKHFIFLMQENHTFDNYFGTRPGVDGLPKGTCMPVTRGATECVKPYHLGQLGSLDLDHTAQAFKIQYNHGKMDGFIEGVSTRGKDGRLAMAYYDDRDLPYYWNIADNYVLFDRFFSSSDSGSVRNHMYRVTGSPGVSGKSEAIPPKGWGRIPTIFDRLEAKGITWKWYVENYDPTITFRTRTGVEDVDRGAQVIWVPLLGYARYIDDPRLFSKIVDMDEYYTDAARGNLPSVAFVSPAGDSEHPPGSVQAGQTLIRALITELMRSPNWSDSAFLWSYDDWGGWYDHVTPPRVDRHGYGFRVPALLVSAYAKKGYVDSTTLDFTSALKFITHNWGLKPLAARDRRANDFLGAFDFSAPPRDPVFLGLDRKTVAAKRIAGRPVYWTYATAVGVVVALTGFASLSGRRGRRSS